VSEAAERLLCVGDLNADITITTAVEVVVGSDTPGTVVVSGGGSAANVSAWAARSGSASRFAGAVGDDQLGDFLVSELAGNGVDVRAVRRNGVGSRAIAALVGGDGDRSMVSALDTATVLVLDDVDPAWFDAVDWLHLTAYTYFPQPGRDAFGRLADIAAERSIPWSIDPSSVEMLDSLCRREDALAAFANAAVMFPNADEAAWLASTDDPAAAAEQLLDVCDTVVVTCGADGAVVARRDTSTFHVDAEQVDVVNTLGCGDAFAAGFIAGRLQGLGDERCASLASSTAARVAAMSSAR